MPFLLFFTSSRFGQTNRVGYSVGAFWQWVPEKIRFGASYTVSQLINSDPSGRQLDHDIISLNLETAYDLFK